MPPETTVHIVLCLTTEVTASRGLRWKCRVKNVPRLRFTGVVRRAFGQQWIIPKRSTLPAECIRQHKSEQAIFKRIAHRPGFIPADA